MVKQVSSHEHDGRWTPDSVPVIVPWDLDFSKLLCLNRNQRLARFLKFQFETANLNKMKSISKENTNAAWVCHSPFQKSFVSVLYTSGIILPNLNLRVGTLCVIKYLKINVTFLGSSLFESFKFN